MLCVECFSVVVSMCRRSRSVVCYRFILVVMIFVLMPISPIAVMLARSIHNSLQ